MQPLGFSESYKYRVITPANPVVDNKFTDSPLSYGLTLSHCWDLKITSALRIDIPVKACALGNIVTVPLQSARMCWCDLNTARVASVLTLEDCFPSSMHLTSR